MARELRLALALVVATQVAFASSNFSALDVGVMGTNLVQRFSAPPGYASQVSDLDLFLRFRRALHLGHNFFFEPSFATLLPWRSSADGNAKTFTSFLALDVTVPVWKFLRLRLGPGVQWGLIVSSSGPIPLNNGGANVTSTFYSPGGVTNQFLLTVQGGLELRFSPRYLMELEVLVPDVASHLRRRYHGVMAIGVTL